LINGSVATPALINSGFKGIIRLDEGPMLFAAQPILTSQATGPARGVLFMGSYLDNAVVAELSGLTQEPLTLTTISFGQQEMLESSSDPLKVAMTANLVKGTIRFADSNGNPYLIFHTEMARSIHREGSWAIGWYNVIIVLIVIVVSLLGLRIAKSWILDRFQNLKNVVGKIADTQDFSMRIPIAEKDYEIKHVSVAINNLLERLCDAQNSLRDNEQKLLGIIQFLPDAVMVTDLNSNVVAWNGTMENLTGIKSREIIGKGNYEYSLAFYGERCPMPSDILMQLQLSADKTVVSDNGRAVFSELVLQREQKEDVYLSIAASVLRNSNSEVVGAIESIRDITSQKKSEALLLASLKEKETLLKEIQHRVKNNLQVVSSLLEMQSHFVVDARDAGLFTESQRRINTLSLVYSKLYKSNDLANIKLKDYLTELVDNLLNSHELNNKNIRSRIEIDDISIGLDMAIPCGLITNELVVNSLKYAFPNGRSGLITITGRRLEGSTVELNISDDGIGIPKTVEPGTTPTLGLDLVRTLVELQLEGTMEISRDGGTGFKIIFKMTDT